MIDFESIRDQIKDNLALPFGKVEIAANVDAVMENDPKVKVSIFIIPSDDGGEVRQSSTVMITNVAANAQILIGIKDVKDATGRSRSGLTDYRKAIAGLIQGYQAPGASQPLAFTNGRLLEFANGYYWQLDNYETHYTIRST